MSFGAYLKSSIWDFILVYLASLGLGYTLLHVFYIDPAIEYTILPAVICFIALVLLFLVVYNKRTVLMGSIIYAVLCIVALFISLLISPLQMSFVDTEGNYFYFMLVLLLTPTVSFLMTRLRAGTAFYFVLGAFVCALVQFLYGYYEVIWLVIFILAALGIIAYKNFQFSAQSVTSLRTLSFPAGFLTALLSALIIIGLGCLIWFVVIAPLNPGAFEIKLVTEYYALETESQHGTSNVFQIPNTDLSSNDIEQEGDRTSDDLWEQEDGTQIPGSPYGVIENRMPSSGGSVSGIDVNSPEDIFNFETYDLDLWWLLYLVVPLIILLILAYFIGRRIHRRIRLSHMQQLEPRQQVTALYQFLMSRFGRVGLGIVPGLTLSEYAHNSVDQMRHYDQDQELPFRALTTLYSDVAYGGCTPTQEEVGCFAAYYRGFWKASRKYLGNVRYFFRSFRL